MYVKKLYKLFLFLSFLSVIFIPLFLEVKNNNISIKKKSNFNKKELPDAISPICNYLNQNNFITNNNIQEIEIEIPESRRWYKNMILASISNSGGIIRERYKKKFRGSLYLKDDDERKCKIPIKLRISGDSKEHIVIDGDEIFSSIDISLLNDNIYGIVKFKLFLPDTRGGDSEIVTSTILEELGYLSPRTKKINVQINNLNVDMIFQEKAAKEMFEYNKLRESAVVESNEHLLWQLRTKGLGRSFNSLLFPKILNANWLGKSKLNKSISLESLKILSNAIHESWTNKLEEENSFSDLILSNFNISNESKLSSYRLHVLSMGAYHSLINHNRRFYYDAFNNSLIPIYYDGNSRVINYSQSQLEEDLNLINAYNMLREITIEDINIALKELSLLNSQRLKILLDLRGVYLSEIEIENILKNIKNNLQFLKKNVPGNQSISWGRDPLNKYVDSNNNYGMAFSNDGELFNMCDMKMKSCKNIFLNDKDSKKIISDKLRFNGIDYYYYGKNYEYFTNKEVIFSDIKSSNNIKIDKVNIEIIGKNNFKIDEKRKIINFTMINPLDKFVIYESELDGWKINLIQSKKYNNDSITLKNRYNKKLLTGILTIQDSKLNELEINIDGGKAEDSLNIIRSKGNIRSINITNSYQDAADFDFSDLDISEIYISNAGNDCLDFSLGNYRISKIEAYNCSDKGISVGENSEVFINNVILDSSNINAVSKDSSKLFIENAEFRNYNLCIAAYRKKQEFGGSFIQIPINTCLKEKIIIQDNSILNFKK